MGDLNYIKDSVQGHNLLLAAILGIGIVAIAMAYILRNEKKLQAGNEDEH